jgi:hypothetical protein
MSRDKKLNRTQEVVGSSPFSSTSINDFPNGTTGRSLSRVTAFVPDAVSGHGCGQLPGFRDYIALFFQKNLPSVTMSRRVDSRPR